MRWHLRERILTVGGATVPAMTSALPEHLRPIVSDMSVPVDEQGRWIDSGRWREVGVTHWHLIEPREWAISDSARFSTEDMRASRVRSSAGVARDPHEVVAWLTATLDKLISEHGLTEEILQQSGILTPEGRRSKDETAFWMASRGMDVCAMQALKGGRISHYSAYAMTAQECTAPH
jgi:hypothetical protein